MKYVLLAISFASTAAFAAPVLRPGNYVLTESLMVDARTGKAARGGNCEEGFQAEINRTRDGKTTLWLGTRKVFLWQNLEPKRTEQGACSIVSQQMLDDAAQVVVTEDLEQCAPGEPAFGSRRRTLTLKRNAVELRMEKLIKSPNGQWTLDPETPVFICRYAAASK